MGTPQISSCKACSGWVLTSVYRPPLLQNPDLHPCLHSLTRVLIQLDLRCCHYNCIRVSTASQGQAQKPSLELWAPEGPGSGPSSPLPPHTVRAGAPIRGARTAHECTVDEATLLLAQAGEGEAPRHTGTRKETALTRKRIASQQSHSQELSAVLF